MTMMLTSLTSSLSTAQSKLTSSPRRTIWKVFSDSATCLLTREPGRVCSVPVMSRVNNSVLVP